MEIIYIILAVVALYMECSKSVDTRNLFKKAALFGIVLGSILEFGGIHNHLIEFSALAYIIIDVCPVIFKIDRRKTKRNIEQEQLINKV